MFEDDDPAPRPGNSPEYTVSELSGAVKRIIEGEFGLIRVRGEVGRVSRPASGHLYFDLKDDRNVIAAISWKGQVSKMQVRPEEGMEVIATGRMTTFPGQSKYQMIVEDVAPAGAGALMAMLEKRKAALTAEGLFDPARKKPIPYLPTVIGVITSPSGAVIRDILHRLRDRFPRHVLIWPVAVQGQSCAPDVAAAIRGFNAIQPGGTIPRPDLIIVARGGGSLEDLWGFNEEIVVRAAAASKIPLISAVGHETDTTLIDYASDLRAPTPTAAAEMAVPVRADLLATLADLAARQSRASRNLLDRRGQRLRDLSRALPRLDALLAAPRQRHDTASQRLGGALSLATARKRTRFEQLSTPLRPTLLHSLIQRAINRLTQSTQSLQDRTARRMERAHASLDKWASRLAPALARLIATSARDITQGRTRLIQLDQRLTAANARDFATVSARLTQSDQRLNAALPNRLATLTTRLEAIDRTRQTLGYTETLRRGYAVVRGDGAVVTTKDQAERATALEIEFQDGRLTPKTGPKKLKLAEPKPVELKPAGPKPGQGSLF